MRLGLISFSTTQRLKDMRLGLISTKTEGHEMRSYQLLHNTKTAGHEIRHSNKEIIKATPTEIESAIRKLNTGKASDENGIVSEHYIHASDVITDEITDIINQIFEKLDVPQSLKNGILTPVLKKKKDKTIPGNYRGIVVTIVFETIIKDRLEPELFPSQNTLQRGFTEGASSLFTAFIVSETTMLYKFLKIVLELLTLDAEKATHEIMLNKMFHDGIRGDMWVLLKNIYTNMTLQVKWGDQTTQHVNIQQGIRQGAKLSTLLYKRYNNTILKAITGSHLGTKIENPTENPHNIWKAARNNQNDIRKAEFKSRLITGTYMLQTTKAKFSKNQISRICELSCTKAEEDIKHFLLECESLESVRLKQMNKFLSLTEFKGEGDKANYKEDVLQIILHCSKLSTTSLSHLKLANDLIEIEKQISKFLSQNA
ncbi:unnamed protein product [Mytilus edulis]|uniref:Reverse transcriptase domain-containing protein n=1 Tax=Mytilus edulis TaxID=6550 RepID=A0A8S3RDI5_MYTED|nr:unnamed protein product [Mytilus edulis]